MTKLTCHLRHRGGRSLASISVVGIERMTSSIKWKRLNRFRQPMTPSLKIVIPASSQNHDDEGVGGGRNLHLFHGNECGQRGLLPNVTKLEKGNAVSTWKWWTWPGSNRRPLPCHGSALPAAPQAHFNRMGKLLIVRSILAYIG